jgi:flagellar biogenesis protein FliO
MDATLLRAFFTLICCVAGLGALLFFVKKYVGRSKQKLQSLNLEIISRVSLQQKNHLYVVRAGTKTLLIGVSDHSVSTLADLTEEDGKGTIDQALLSLGAAKNAPARTPELSQTTVGADIPSFGDFLKSIIKGERVG